MLPNITLSYSIRLALFFSFVHIGALLCVSLSAVSGGLKIALLMICVMSLAWCLLRYAFVLLPICVIKIWVDANRAWHLQTKNGTVHTADLQGDSVITPWLIILNFKRTGRRFSLSVMVCKDNVGKDNVSDAVIRRLRLYLI